jgi:GNAT superfamily N-acetyltransferase
VIYILRVIMPSMKVRFAREAEIDRLAQIWYEAWHDAHARIVPPELVRRRTLAQFRARLLRALPTVRVVGRPGAPVGLCMVKRDELDQLFVAAEARGTGAAAALVADAEARLAAAGVKIAWLACAIGNDRAARFYEKCGWRRTGTFTSHLRTAEGKLDLDVWRYEKALL